MPPTNGELGELPHQAPQLTSVTWAIPPHYFEQKDPLSHLGRRPLSSSNGCTSHREGADPVTIWEDQVSETIKIQSCDSILATSNPTWPRDRQYTPAFVGRSQMPARPLFGAVMGFHEQSPQCVRIPVESLFCFVPCHLMRCWMSNDTGNGKFTLLDWRSKYMKLLACCSGRIISR